MPRDKNRERDMEEQTRSIGTLIGSGLPPGVGFLLCLFEFGEKGWSTYISNAQRRDIVNHLRDLADRLEGD